MGGIQARGWSCEEGCLAWVAFKTKLMMCDGRVQIAVNQ